MTATAGVRSVTAASVPPTSVRRPARTMGTLAAHMLLQETDAHAGEHRHQRIVLQAELVVRKSSLA